MFALSRDFLIMRGCPYNFAVEEVFLDHDGVDCSGVLEREKAKATRSACGTVSHDCTFLDFAELREVVV